MNELNKLIKVYHNNDGKPINFDFKESYISLFSKNNKDSLAYHYIHFYPGRIYPYIPRYLLSLPEIKEMNGILLDPFAGSGTILLESLINSLANRESWGVEINPVGRLISKVKITPFDTTIISEYMKELHSMYRTLTNVSNFIPSYNNLQIWFSEDAIYKLAKLKGAILNMDFEENIKDFFWLCLSGVVRKVSMADPYIPPPVRLKLEKYNKTPKYNKLKAHLERANSPNLWNIFEEEVISNVKKLNSIFSMLKNASYKGKIIWNDAKKLKKGTLLERGIIDKNNSSAIPSNSIDIIFTSPPYLTAQKYIRTSKLELLWLGYSVDEINDMEKKSIGTERIKLSDISIQKLGYKNIDSLIEKTNRISKSRALMVYLYFKDMIEAVKEFQRVLKNSGYLIFVVGDNKVSGKWIGTYRLLANIIDNTGFEEKLTLKDTIKSRSMLTRRNGSGGLIKEEYVMIFQKEG